jgi:hypothetical protein
LVQQFSRAIFHDLLLLYLQKRNRCQHEQ